LQACLYEDETCLERWAAGQDESFDHIYLWLGSSPRVSALALSLRQSGHYRLVYETSAVLIFVRR